MSFSSTMIPASCLIAALFVAPATTSQDDGEQDEMLTFEFGQEGGMPLTEFLEMAQSVLDVPIQYDYDEVENVVIRTVGNCGVSRSEFREFFESVAYTYSFIVMEFDDYLAVMPIPGSGTPGCIKGLALKPA